MPLPMVPFKVGEIVRLKAGGPAMVVVEAPSALCPLVYCTWSSERSSTQAGYLPDALERTAAPPPVPLP